MNETVATVNGYNITRMVGTRGHYTVTTRVFKGGNSQFITFRTQKAAREWCENATPCPILRLA